MQRNHIDMYDEGRIYWLVKWCEDEDKLYYVLCGGASLGIELRVMEVESVSKHQGRLWKQSSDRRREKKYNARKIEVVNIIKDITR